MINSPRLTLAQRIRAWRTLRGYTRPQLALLAGLPQRSIEDYEAGHEPRASRVVILAAALGITTDQLLGVDPIAPSRDESLASVQDPLAPGQSPA